jgi:peptidoglycan/xylan/chitin deacetylase (PgdA/CDA1 family)
VSGRREQLARALDRAHLLDLVLRARARLRAPFLTVLTYHHIAEPDPVYPYDPEVADATPRDFRQQLGVLRRHFSVIDVEALCAAIGSDNKIDARRLPPNPVLITFDDAYLSCRDTAVPMLQEHGFTAVFFVPTGYVGGRRLFWWERIFRVVNESTRAAIELDYPQPIRIPLASPHNGGRDDRRAAAATLVKTVKNTRGLDIERFLTALNDACGVPWSDVIERELTDELIMTWKDLASLRAAGMDIESHTRHHRVLQTLDDDALRVDLSGAQDDFQQALGTRVRTIAYPVGRSIASEPRIRRAVVEAGYRLGFSNGNGINPLWKPLDPLDVRRVALDRGTSLTMFRGQLAVPALAYHPSKPANYTDA